jgi:hypothetical protein
MMMLSHLLYILMYSTSFHSLPTMKLNIHNQCLNFKLTKQTFFTNCETSDEYLAWKVDTGNMTSVGLIPSLSVFEGVLSYVLQRKNVESSEKFEATNIRLFVAWKSEGYKKLRACVQLIECNEEFNWNSTKLEEYCQRYADQLGTYTDPINDTWLIHDDATLMTKLELDFTQRDDVLNIIISEGVKDDYTRRPLWIDPKR